MIDRMYDELAFGCDACPNSTDYTPSAHFDELVRASKERGWKITPVGDGWQHLCPDCANESALERARRKFRIK